MKLKNIFKYAKDFTSSCWYKIFYKKPNVLSDEETIEYILKNKCSISRFGDGELQLIRGIDLEFQKYDKRLADKLEGQKTSEKCLVCVPSIFDKRTLNREVFIEGEYNYWKSFNRKRGGLWYYYFKGNKVLGDAFISRFYLRKADKSKTAEYVSKLKQLWNDRNIVFVEGEKSRLGVGNDLFDNAKSIKRILCPAVDAFDKYDEIKTYIEENCKSDDLIIMALGPSATAMAYELSGKFQCLDLGHIDIEYEWFKMGATEKVVIAHKFVNELADGKNPIAVENSEYTKQIIRDFSK